jgi:CheY-like chemotaxis protein
MNRHILLVEDNEDDAFLMCQAKSKAGIPNPMHIARDGRRAIAYLKGEDEFHDRIKFPLPTLILLDLKLPYVTGHEVLQWIRTQSLVPTSLVVVLTASKDASDIEAAYRAGANSYLVKPSCLDALRDLVISTMDYWLARNEPPTFPSLPRQRS